MKTKNEEKEHIELNLMPNLTLKVNFKSRLSLILTTNHRPSKPNNKIIKNKHGNNLLVFLLFLIFIFPFMVCLWFAFSKDDHTHIHTQHTR